MKCILCDETEDFFDNEYFKCRIESKSEQFCHFFCCCFFPETVLKLPNNNTFDKEKKEVEILNIENISADQYLDDCSLCLQPSDGSCAVKCSQKLASHLNQRVRIHFSFQMFKEFDKKNYYSRERRSIEIPGLLQ